VPHGAPDTAKDTTMPDPSHPSSGSTPSPLASAPGSSPARNTRDPVEASNASPMNPGDEAPPGTPGTGENVCPVCHGGGKVRGAACANCGGTGRIVAGIGGA
jgi:hypothetical protein